jgi:hypothetical protein
MINILNSITSISKINVISKKNIRDEYETFHMEKNQMSNNHMLISAIIIGSILACLVGIIGMYLGVQILNLFFNHLNDESKHLERYIRRNKELELQSNVDNPVDDQDQGIIFRQQVIVIFFLSNNNLLS